ncbi:hypothetical protein [Desulfosporosinus orientis]|uniref:hypothetical protein n=1 Tax=Desulfosporosinus orientis TaxID=1563 RepID=UPI0002F1E84E|nr:hypothetical protein [Desulfosporosinus orientis]
MRQTEKNAARAIGSQLIHGTIKNYSPSMPIDKGVTDCDPFVAAFRNAVFYYNE